MTMKWKAAVAASVSLATPRWAHGNFVHVDTGRVRTWEASPPLHAWTRNSAEFSDHVSVETTLGDLCRNDVEGGNHRNRDEQ